MNIEFKEDTQPFTVAEEKGIFQRLAATEKGSDEYISLRNEIMMHNIRLVWSIAHSLHKKAGAQVEIDDLFQAGCFGLIRAIEKFDLSFGTRFSTYAVNWIRQSIFRFISHDQNMIKVPFYLNESVNRVNRIRSELTQKLGHTPSNLEVAAELPVKENNRIGFGASGAQITAYYALKKMKHRSPAEEAQLAELREAIIRVRADYLDWMDQALLDSISLNVSVSPNGSDDGEGDTELGDFCADPSETPEDSAITNICRNEVLQVLFQDLTPKERGIIMCRYGLNPENRVYTLSEIGELMNLSRERIRQIEVQAISKMRLTLMHKGLTSADVSALVLS